MKFRIFLLINFIVFTCCLSQVIKTIELDSEDKTYSIARSSRILEDKTNSLTINDLISEPYNTRFEECKLEYPNLGITSSTYWFHFRIKSKISFRGFLFNIGYLFHDRLEMYRVKDGIAEQIFFSDIDKGLISHNHTKRDRFVVPMPFQENDINDYYLAIKDREGTTLFLELSSEENFLKRQAADSLRVGIVSGIFFLASIFALIIYLRDKYIPYLFFFLLNCFFILSMLCHNGSLQILLWPGNLKLNHDFFIFSCFMTSAFSFLFTTYFLQLKERLPSFHVPGLILSAIMIIGALSPIIGLDQFLIVFYFSIILGSAFEIMVSIMSLRKGYVLGLPFLVSRLLFSSSLIVFELVKLGWLPYLGISYDIMFDLLLCLQVILMAFVITDYKYKVEIGKLEEEKDKAKQRNEELFNANKVKMEFLGMASHDLKGPLRNITSLASFIENKQINKEEEIIQMSSMIRQTSEKLANLVKDLLDNTALEMGKLELKLEELDILKAIQIIIDQYEFEAKRKNQTIHMVVNLEKKLKVALDEIRFSQVIENLVSNAIKFSPYGKNVWIIVSKPENASVLIEIKDEGPGFTEDDKQFLFNYYKKLSAKPTGKENSSGLGLSIVKKIVQLHNGRIWLESEHGKGASFFVEF